MIVYTSVTTPATNVITYFKLVNPATGVPETALTIANLDATYVRDGAAAVKNDLSTPGGYTVSSAHTDNAAIVVDATNAPGLYRVDWPDAAFAAAAGVNRVQLCVNGAAIDPAYIEVELMTPVAEYTIAAVSGAVGSVTGNVGGNVGGNVTGSVGSVTGAVTLAAVQNAITWAQQKIVANVANEGALDIRNANAAGHGTLNDGGNIGLYNSGGSMGQYNYGTTDYGIYAAGALAGQYNLGNGGAGYGQYNAGDAIGQMNAGSGLASIGQLNEGIIDGQKNDGGTRGQYSIGGTYGQLNAGGTDGINATGTANAGLQVTGGADGLLATGTAGYGGNFAGGTAALNPDLATAADVPAAADNADAVWDELLALHVVPGSASVFLAAAGGAADPWLTPLPGAYVAGTAGNIIGNLTPTVFPAGAIPFTYTVTDSVTTLPIEGVEVWISTDNPAVNIVWKGDTDAFGVARDVNGNLPNLDVGLYYFWRQKAGYTFTDPDSETAS